MTKPCKPWSVLISIMVVSTHISEGRSGVEIAKTTLPHCLGKKCGK